MSDQQIPDLLLPHPRSLFLQNFTGIHMTYRNIYDHFYCLLFMSYHHDILWVLDQNYILLVSKWYHG